MAVPPTLIHVSHKCLKMIDPQCSEGKTARSWFVEWSMIDDLVSYVRAKRKCRKVYIHVVRGASIARLGTLRIGKSTYYFTREAVYVSSRFVRE